MSPDRSLLRRRHRRWCRGDNRAPRLRGFRRENRLITTTIGNFTLVRLLGRGGMGEVYEAQADDGSRVALKVFSNGGEHAAFLKKRFLAEGRLLARLDHPRLVKVRHLDIDAASGRPYFAMDLVLDATGHSRTLEDSRRERAPDEVCVAGIYADLREVLAYLHGQGIAHRDVKLENVLMDPDGHAVLSDFGISRIFDESLRADLAVTTTMAGEKAPIMGSFGYLAPELKQGVPASPASDAYALGVLVFRLLTGVWYEAGSTAGDLLAGFDPAWRNVLGKLLNNDPFRRLPMPERIELGRRRGLRRFWLVGASVGLVALAGALLFGYLRTRTPAYTFDEFFPAEEAMEP